MDIISDESLFYKKLNSLFLVCANLLIYIDVWENNFIDISLRQRMTKQRHTVLFIQISHHGSGCNQRFNNQDITTLSVVGKMLYDCNKPYFIHHLFNYIIIHFFFQLPSIIITVKIFTYIFVFFLRSTLLNSFKLIIRYGWRRRFNSFTLKEIETF